MFSFISDSTRAFSIIASDAWLFLAFAQKVEIFETKKSFYFCCVLYKWLFLSFLARVTKPPLTHSYTNTRTRREKAGIIGKICVFFKKRSFQCSFFSKKEKCTNKLSLFMLSIYATETEKKRYNRRRVINYAALESSDRKNLTNYIILRAVFEVRQLFITRL